MIICSGKLFHKLSKGDTTAKVANMRMARKTTSRSSTDVGNRCASCKLLVYGRIEDLGETATLQYDVVVKILAQIICNGKHEVDFGALQISEGSPVLARASFTTDLHNAITAQVAANKPALPWKEGAAKGWLYAIRLLDCFLDVPECSGLFECQSRAVGTLRDMRSSGQQPCILLYAAVQAEAEVFKEWLTMAGFSSVDAVSSTGLISVDVAQYDVHLNLRLSTPVQKVKEAMVAGMKGFMIHLLSSNDFTNGPSLSAWPHSTHLQTLCRAFRDHVRFGVDRKPLLLSQLTKVLAPDFSPAPVEAQLSKDIAVLFGQTPMSVSGHVRAYEGWGIRSCGPPAAQAIQVCRSHMQSKQREAKEDISRRMQKGLDLLCKVQRGVVRRLLRPVVRSWHQEILAISALAAKVEASVRREKLAAVATSAREVMQQLTVQYELPKEHTPLHLLGPDFIRTWTALLGDPATRPETLLSKANAETEAWSGKVVSERLELMAWSAVYIFKNKVKIIYEDGGTRTFGGYRAVSAYEFPGAGKHCWRLARWILPKTALSEDQKKLIDAISIRTKAERLPSDKNISCAVKSYSDEFVKEEARAKNEQQKKDGTAPKQLSCSELLLAHMEQKGFGPRK